MKRSAEVQGSKDGWDTMDQTVDAPQRASAAQLAKRKILKGRSHLKSGQTTPTESHGPSLSFGKPAGSPFGNVDPNILNGSQSLQNGFAQNGFGQNGFGQNGFQFGNTQNGFGQTTFSPELNQQPSTSFGSDHSNDSAISTSNPTGSIFGNNNTGFNFSVPQSAPVVNPFTFANGNSNSDENKPKGFIFSGSIFNLGGNQGKEQEDNREMPNGKQSAEGEQGTPKRRGFLNGGSFGNNNASNGDEAPQWAPNSPFNFTATQPTDKPLFNSNSTLNFSSNQPTDKLSTPSLFSSAPSQPVDKPSTLPIFNLTPSQAIDKPSTPPIFNISPTQPADKPPATSPSSFFPAQPADKPAAAPLFNFASSQSADKPSSNLLFNFAPNQPADKPVFGFSPSQPTEKSLFNGGSTFDFSASSSRGQSPEKEASSKAQKELEQKQPSSFAQPIAPNLFSSPTPQESASEELFVSQTTVSESTESVVGTIEASKSNTDTANKVMQAEHPAKAPSPGAGLDTEQAEPASDPRKRGTQSAELETQGESSEASPKKSLDESKQSISTSIEDSQATKASEEPKPASSTSTSALSQQRPLLQPNLFDLSSKVQSTKSASTPSTQSSDAKSMSQPTSNLFAQAELQSKGTTKKTTNLFAQSARTHSPSLSSPKPQQKPPLGVSNQSKAFPKSQSIRSTHGTKGEQDMQGTEDRGDEGRRASSSGKRDAATSNHEITPQSSSDSHLQDQEATSVNHKPTDNIDMESYKTLHTKLPPYIPDLSDAGKQEWIRGWRLLSLDRSFKHLVATTPAIYAIYDTVFQEYRDAIEAIQTAPHVSIPPDHPTSSTLSPELVGQKRKADETSIASTTKKTKSKDDVQYPLLPLPTPLAQQSETSKMFANLAKGDPNGSSPSNIFVFGQHSAPAAQRSSSTLASTSATAPVQPVHSFFPTAVSTPSMPPTLNAPAVATISASVLSVPQFGGASSGSSFLGQFAKQADEISKKRKAEESSSDSDESDEDEEEEKAVKKQKVNETAGAGAVLFEPGKGFQFAPQKADAQPASKPAAPFGNLEFPPPTPKAAVEPSPKLGENPFGPGTHGTQAEAESTAKPTGKSLFDRITPAPATSTNDVFKHPFINFKSTSEPGAASSILAQAKSTPFANLGSAAGGQQKQHSNIFGSSESGSAGKAPSSTSAPFSFTKQAAPLVSNNSSPVSVLASGVMPAITSDNIFAKYATGTTSGGESGLVSSSSSVFSSQPSLFSQRGVQPAYMSAQQPIDDDDEMGEDEEDEDEEMTP